MKMGGPRDATELPTPNAELLVPPKCCATFNPARPGGVEIWIPVEG